MTPLPTNNTFPAAFGSQTGQLGASQGTRRGQTMSGGDAAYSFSLTTFSRTGKLLQIEYALNAAQQGKTSLGIKGRSLLHTGSFLALTYVWQAPHPSAEAGDLFVIIQPRTVWS
eukprot:25916-Eustigmatos_ZCMA.PRE.1